MPTYPYKCNACGHEFDLFQSIMAKPTRKCPVCGKNRVQRMIAAGAGLIFKGSGFYATDYRSDAYNTSAKADTAATVPSTDAKPADAKPSGDSKPASETKTAGETKPAEAKPANTEKSVASSRQSKAPEPKHGPRPEFRFRLISMTQPTLCPICKKPVLPANDPAAPNRWFPFCSDRCQLIDLGRWLGERYQIPASPESTTGDDPADRG